MRQTKVEVRGEVEDVHTDMNESSDDSLKLRSSAGIYQNTLKQCTLSGFVTTLSVIWLWTV